MTSFYKWCHCYTITAILLIVSTKHYQFDCLTLNGWELLINKPRVPLTNRNAAVRPTEIDVTLRGGSHADLVKCPCEEGSKGAGKSNSSVTSGTTNRNAHLKRGRLYKKSEFFIYHFFSKRSAVGLPTENFSEKLSMQLKNLC